MATLRRTTSVPKPDTVVALEPMISTSPTSNSATLTPSDVTPLNSYRCTLPECNYQASNKFMFCQKMVCLGHYTRYVGSSNYSCPECHARLNSGTASVWTVLLCILCFLVVIGAAFFISLL
jgi:hypothetical protein